MFHARFPENTLLGVGLRSTNRPEDVEAAVVHRWGPVVAGDEFNYEGSPDRTKWMVYDSAGHDGNGLRKPAQIEVRAGRATIRGTAEGTTGGMAAKFDRRRYGRWETRMRVAERDEHYHAVLSLWPDSDNWPCDGEVDYAEATDDLTSVTFFHHYSCANRQASSRKALDPTQWHNYAVEWTSSAIVGYLDGVEWFRDTIRPTSRLARCTRLSNSTGSLARRRPSRRRWMSRGSACTTLRRPLAAFRSLQMCVLPPSAT